MSKDLCLPKTSGSFTNRRSTFINSAEQVLVSYKILWVDGVTEISDQFLWPKQQRDIKDMKMFAINFLSDILGAKNISKYESFHVLAFANFIAYVINREIDLSDNLDEFSVESMVKDGHFGHSGMGYGEHIEHINLKFKELVETIEWDICNPDN